MPARLADILAREVDFFSIGTNDLIQYTLAIDRGNRHVAHLHQPLHPAILRMIKRTCDVGREKGIKTYMCGEMAGDPRLTRLLIGLGLTEFSMQPASLLEVKRIIKLSDAGKLTDTAGQILGTGDYARRNTLLEEITDKCP